MSLNGIPVNWRLRAIDSLEQEDSSQMHYSAAVTLSKEDANRVKDILLEAVKKSVDTIRGSKDEEAFALTIDFFTMKMSL